MQRQHQQIQTALAQGRQQQYPVDTGACGGGMMGMPNPGFGLSGYPGYGGGCMLPGPGVAPTFPYTPPGVVASFKTLGANGIITNDGTIYRIDGVIVVDGTPIYNVTEIATDGQLNVTIDDGYATVCGWKWMQSDGILIVSAQAEKDFVPKVLNTMADAFNVDGCACPIAFTCITEDDSLQMTLQYIGLDDTIQISTDGVGLTDTVVGGLFSFALYLNVYETIGTCGIVAPIFPMQACAQPAMPCPPVNGGYDPQMAMMPGGQY